MDINSAKLEACTVLSEEVKKICKHFKVVPPVADIAILDSRYFTKDKNYMFFINEEIGLREVMAESNYFIDTVMLLDVPTETNRVLMNRFSYDMARAEAHFLFVVKKLSTT